MLESCSNHVIEMIIACYWDDSGMYFGWVLGTHQACQGPKIFSPRYAEAFITEEGHTNHQGERARSRTYCQWKPNHAIHPGQVPSALAKVDLTTGAKGWRTPILTDRLSSIAYAREGGVNRLTDAVLILFPPGVCVRILLRSNAVFPSSSTM